MSKAVKASVLSRQLRRGESKSLARRRYIVGASLFCCGTMSLASLYQMGVIPRVPDVSWPRFDSNDVMGSGQAYEILNMPDAPLGVASYAATAGLAAMGGIDRNSERPSVTVLMAAKVLVDALFAAKLIRDQFVRQQRTFCIWCLATSAVTISMLVPALAEVAVVAGIRKSER